MTSKITIGPMLYHSSPTINRSSILANGLTTQADRTGMSAVFLADIPLQHAHFDLWAVDVKGLALEGDNADPEEGAWYMCFENIEPMRLKLVPTPDFC